MWPTTREKDTKEQMLCCSRGQMRFPSFWFLEDKGENKIKLSREVFSSFLGPQRCDDDWADDVKKRIQVMRMGDENYVSLSGGNLNLKEKGYGL